MGIDPERQINASVVLQREIYNQIKEIAKRDKRSISNLMSIWLDILGLASVVSILL